MHQRRARWSTVALWAALVCAFTAVACRPASDSKIFRTRSVTSESGLSMELPVDFEVARMASALRLFSPQRERTRSPPSIILTVATQRPDMAASETKELARRPITYAVTKEAGGSGGESLHLKASVESNGRFIVLDSTVQPESGGDAAFAVEWAILPTLRWTPDR